MKIIIVNGPNLNLLEKREPSIYGGQSFDTYFKFLQSDFNKINLEHYQSNIEGDIIDKLQSIGFSYDYIILNAGGYTHTSVAIADCIAAISTPVYEVHISNIYQREEFRKKSLLSEFCIGTIVGMGLDGYRLIINHIINK